MVYKWKEGSRFTEKKASAQVVGEHLQGLRDRNDTLTPQLVVTDARNKKSPTHGLFQWDDTAAAREFRLSQARDLLRSVTVVVSVQHDDREAEATSRAFVVVTKADERVYEAVATALNDDDMRAQLITQARRELIAFKKKYEQLSELAAVFESIDAALPILQAAEGESNRPAA